MISEPNSATESSNPDVEDEGGGRTAVFKLLYHCFTTALLLHYYCNTTDASQSAQPSGESAREDRALSDTQRVTARLHLTKRLNTTDVES